MNSVTANGTIESLSCFSATAYKIGQNIALQLSLILAHAVSLMANSFLVLIVYNTPTLRKPMNYFILNMAMSDLLYSIFWVPFHPSTSYTNSWLIVSIQFIIKILASYVAT